MENSFMPINNLIFAPVNAIQEADIELSNGIIKQIATFSDIKNENSDTPIMKLKNIKFLYEKIKADELGDRIETVGLTVPTASIIPLSALQISSSVIQFNIEVKSDCDDSSEVVLKGKTAAEKIRESDHLPKMSFKIKTEATTIPEGVARLIDVLDVNQVPNVEEKVYINSDGISYDNQEIHSVKNKIIAEISSINSLLDKINAFLNNLKQKTNSPQELYASEMDNLNAKVSELTAYLKKYSDIKTNKEKELLLAEMRILEDKIKHGE